MKSAWQETPIAMRIVGFLTVVWFALLFLLLESSEPCQGADALKWWQLGGRYIACRPANEIGDFLSGAFAPVAFAWLVVTVVIQSSELREQRRELALNRDVASEQREAMRAQAQEAAAQTAVLQAQLDAQRRAAKDTEAISHLRAFNDACHEGNLSALVFTRVHTNTREGVRPLDRVSKSPDANVRAVARTLRGILMGGAIEAERNPHAWRWVHLLRCVHTERTEMTIGNQKRIEELSLVQIANDLSRWADRSGTEAD